MRPSKYPKNIAIKPVVNKLITRQAILKCLKVLVLSLIEPKDLTSAFSLLLTGDFSIRELSCP